MWQYKHMVVVVFFAVVADQLTKYLVLENLTPSQTIVVIPAFFNLVLTFNPGAAFGMMADLQEPYRYFVLGAATFFAIVAVLYFFVKDYRSDFFAQIALSLIIGGAIGNIIDRVRFGMVVDFLDFYIGDNHWPAFNLADSCICLGVVILFLRKPVKTA